MCVIMGFLIKNISTLLNFKYIYEYQYLGNGKNIKLAPLPKKYFKNIKNYLI